MSDLSIASINGLADRWAEIIWAVSWQFCVLAAVVLVIHWLLYRAAPNWRYWLWQILAIKLLLMPFWTAAMPWKTSVDTSTTEVVTDHNQRPASKVNQMASVVHPPSSQPAEKPAPGSHPAGDSTRTIPLATGDRATVSPPSKTPPAHVDSGSLKITATRPEVVPPALPIPIALENPPDHSRLSWQAWLMLAWVVGVLCCSGRIFAQGMALHRRLRQTEPADAGLINLVRESAARLGVHRLPDVRVINLAVSPFVCGLWRPRLIVPQELINSFTAEQLELVLLHELAHIRRRDLILGWIPEFGKILFFFHPVVHFLGVQVRFERELACDQLAMVSSGRDAATYADTLVRVVGQFSSSDAFPLAAVESPQI